MARYGVVLLYAEPAKDRQARSVCGLYLPEAEGHLATRSVSGQSRPLQQHHTFLGRRRRDHRARPTHHRFREIAGLDLNPVDPSARSPHLSAVPKQFGLDPAHLELAELSAAEGCTSSHPLSVWFEQIDETVKRLAVVQRVTVDDEGNTGNGPRRVSPRSPSIRLRTPIIGGSSPPVRRTFHVP
jgi:hypothetical protein